MRFASICSGIGVAEDAWKPIGWQPVFTAEIEAHPNCTLEHHCPDVPNLGDMTAINGDEWRGKIDLLAGGTPCQAFSIAGSRKSLADDRGNLTLKFVELCNAIEPAFIVWENVPGVLSTTDNAFGCFLSGLAGESFAAEPGARPKMGKDSQYWRWDKKIRRHIPKWPATGWVAGPKRSVAWRVLDAQYFGVAQRRERVFLIGCPRNGADPTEILFESDSVRRDSPPSRKAGKDVAGTLEASLGRSRGAGTPVSALTATGVGTCGADDNQAQAGHLIPVWPAEVAPTLNAAFGSKMGIEDQHALGGAGLFVPCTFDRQSSGEYGESGIASTVQARDYKDATDLVVTPPLTTSPYSDNAAEEGKLVVAIPINTQLGLRGAETSNSPREGLGIGKEGDPMFTLQASHSHAVAIGWSEELTAHVDVAATLQHGGQGGRHDGVMQPDMQVRRLTPRECERLQGLPDDYTLIPYRGKPAELCPDGPRYKSLGNAWNRAVAEWLGKRIQNHAVCAAGR